MSKRKSSMYKVYIYIYTRRVTKASCRFITWVPVCGSLSPLESSMPIVQVVSKALHDANDALFGVHYIKPHVHCFSALERSPPPSSGFTLSKVPAQRPPHPHTPQTHFVRPKSSSLAYRLAFVMYVYVSPSGFDVGPVFC